MDPPPQKKKQKNKPPTKILRILNVRKLIIEKFNIFGTDFFRNIFEKKQNKKKKYIWNYLYTRSVFTLLKSKV